MSQMMLQKKYVLDMQCLLFEMGFCRPFFFLDPWRPRLSDCHSVSIFLHIWKVVQKQVSNRTYSWFFPSRQQHENKYFLEYILFETGVVDGISCIWKFCQLLWNFGNQKNYFFFSMGFGSFFKSPQNLKLQQRPPEDLKVLLLGSSRHQLLFEMAPGDPPICKFYLKKWWIFSILVV